MKGTRKNRAVGQVTQNISTHYPFRENAILKTYSISPALHGSARRDFLRQNITFCDIFFPTNTTKNTNFIKISPFSINYTHPLFLHNPSPYSTQLIILFK